MRRIKRLTLFAILLLYCFISEAQTLPSAVSFKTPEVSAINNFIETPVSHYTGVPNISIPLYEIKIKDVSVPVTLNYHAGGIRVDQEATWVGLGWSLDVGGQISRKVKGIPDERYYLLGAKEPSASVQQFKQLPPITSWETSDQRISYLKDAKYGNKDYMPDEFYYTLPGYSGRFMFNQQQNRYILFPKEDIAVKHIEDPNNNKDIQSWNVKLPNGSSIDLGLDGIVSEWDNSSLYRTRSAWQMKTIRNIYNEEINFHYEPLAYTSWKFSGQRYSLYQTSGAGVGQKDAYEQSDAMAKITYYDSKVKTINFPNGTVEFLTTIREDMPGKLLYEIQVKNEKGTIVRKIHFDYDYFFGNYFDALPKISAGRGEIPSSFQYKRLKLTGISISGASGPPLSYHFDYYSSDKLPSKFSFAQDHWGFFNGIDNPSLIPNLPNLIITGGDRRVNPDKSKVFSLKSITYPEGGKTEFEYENNTAGVWNVPHQLFETYQDDNFKEQSETISISSWSRLSDNPDPDYTDPSGVRFFKKKFTVRNGYAHLGNGWSVNTNFGISSLESSMPYEANNAEFTLVRKNADGTETLIRRFNNTAQNYPYERTGSTDSYLDLTDGTYEMVVRLTYSNPAGSLADNQPYNLNFSVRWREFDRSKNMLYTGGQRIKSIKYFTHDGVLAKKKRYSYTNPHADTSIPEFTSGRLVSFPKYFQHNIRRLRGAISYNAIQYGITLYSNSQLPLESTAGSFSGYEYVDEYDEDLLDSLNTLRTSFHYSFNPPYFSQYYTYMNMGMWEPKEWTRGKLKWKKYYKANSVVQEEVYEYYDWSPHLRNETNEDYVEEINTDLISYQYLDHRLEAGNAPEDFFDSPPSLQDMYNYRYFGMEGHCATFHYGADNYYFEVIYPLGHMNPFCADNVDLPYFLHYTGFDKPKNKTIITKDEHGNSIVHTENFFYDKTPLHHQLTRTEALNSAREALKTQFSYPPEYKTQVPYDAMYSRNIFSPVIEQSSFKNATFLKSSKAVYDFWGNGIIAPKLVEAKVGSGDLEIRQRYHSFDAKGNLLEVSKEEDVKTSYLWGYNNSYPVAQAVNATTGEIYYNSFEDGSEGASDPAAKTGVKSYPGNYTLSFSLPAGTNKSFVVTYWAYNGTKWEYKEGTYTGPDKVLTGSKIDEVRVFPQGGLMTTYTYEPLVGMTSQTDANGHTTYYDYDGLGRLMHIRDQDRNILKKFCYNYQGQEEACSPNTAPLWQPTGRTQTITYACAANAAYTVSQPQVEYRDVNTNSSSYTRTEWRNEGQPTSPADWQIVSSFCEQVSGRNTGSQVVTRQDKNPCSASYTQPPVTTTTYNPSACPPPPPCDASCTYPSKRCVGGYCETGQYGVLSKMQVYDGGTPLCVLYLGYRFSDGSSITTGSMTTSGYCD